MESLIDAAVRALKERSNQEAKGRKAEDFSVLWGGVLGDAVTSGVLCPLQGDGRGA